MKENTNLMLASYLPGLRLKALQLAVDAYHADRLVRSVYQHSLRHASELAAHPDPRSYLFQLMSRLAEPAVPLAA
jgi:hypothetical protein